MTSSGAQSAFACCYSMISAVWLYLVPTVIWGSTWIVILGQFGVIAPELSVFYRFVISSCIAFAYCAFRKIKLSFNKSEHFWFALQGLANFSVNYALTYRAEQLVTTGIVAVAFSSLPYFNALGMYFFYGKRIEFRTLLAMIFGAVGLILMFRQQLSLNSASMSGILLALLATFFASIGNLTSMRYLKSDRPIFASVTWAMFYGAIFIGIYCLIYHKKFAFDPQPKFILSLLYLSVFGTVIAFGFYFQLIARVGATKAAYTSIMIPIIALILSALYEDFNWSLEITIGLLFAVLGQILILGKTNETLSKLFSKLHDKS